MSTHCPCLRCHGLRWEKTAVARSSQRLICLQKKSRAQILVPSSDQYGGPLSTGAVSYSLQSYSWSSNTMPARLTTHRWISP